ncbi:hypothetical protein [Paenibacillus foliorum]|nr:hypothetical protein [Paenibacillus foliorum]
MTVVNVIKLADNIDELENDAAEMSEEIDSDIGALYTKMKIKRECET